VLWIGMSFAWLAINKQYFKRSGKSGLAIQRAHSMISKTRASISFVPHADYIALDTKITEFSPASVSICIAEDDRNGPAGFLRMIPNAPEV
jgi:hypothetical protein